MIRMGAGSDSRRTMASLAASSWVKLPVICALPPEIGSLILGAECTTPSSTMAIWRFTFSRVMRSNTLAPSLSKAMETAGLP
jgi:hypothetical protein